VCCLLPRAPLVTSGVVAVAALRMGGGSSRSVSDSIECRSLAVDVQLLDQQLVDLFTFKILCLGAGESGKSTVVKQLKLIHKKQIEKEELDLIAASLHSNIVDCLKAIANACISFGLPPLSEAQAATEQTILSHDDQRRLPPHLAQPILDLFNSPSYQTAYARRSEFWILDSFPYCLKHLSRFLDAEFVPTEEDAVMARIRTTGIVESMLEQKVVKDDDDEPDTIRFHVVDVGGQRNERKKWIHCFSDVKAILFIVNLAGYNAVLFEDSNKNRLHEELELFQQITNNPIFQNTPIALFLNKKDRQKSRHKACTDHQP
jgi:GTPase SAR1 family protein